MGEQGGGGAGAEGRDGAPLLTPEMEDIQRLELFLSLKV